ncbi:MAG: hypothetical protein SFV18_06295 [Bryobacteraceae bacterium]|nr:hypothetical protein [Bryobacteraceae bacterium]
MARLSNLAARLGPVKATSPRSSAKIAQSLRAGHPVETWDCVAAAHAILVFSAAAVERLIADMAAAEVDWRDRSVILCSAKLDSGALQPLAERGALSASFAPIHEDRYIVEGHPAACRAARDLAGHPRQVVVEIETQSKARFLDGLEKAAHAAAAPLTESVTYLRRSGFSAAAAHDLVATVLERRVRTRLRGRDHRVEKRYTVVER